MYTKWTQHLTDEEEKKRFQNQIWSAKPVLERLLLILDEQEKSLDRSEIDPQSFSSPNWAYLQAFKNGDRFRLNYLKTLIDLDQQKEIDK
jgi:hypothetical protein